MRRPFIVIPLISSLLIAGCATNDLGDPRELNKTEQGALIGAAGGAVLGRELERSGSRCR